MRLREPRIEPRAESFWDFREEFKRRVRRFYRLPEPGKAQVRESEPLLSPLNERLLHIIWERQHFDLNGLKLADGRSVRIEDSGRLNGASGPDFQNARLMIDGETLNGDVELHLEGSGWKAHRHEKDIDYNGVILHVILINDDGRIDDRLHNGRRIPRLELEPYLVPDLEALRRTLGPEDFAVRRPGAVGRCYEVMTSATPEELSEFLDLAGEERFNAKLRRLEDQAERAELDQVFYQTLLSALGSGSNKPLYYLLAKRAPLADLKREYEALHENAASPVRAARFLESLLLHVGGLVPPSSGSGESPPDVIKHVENLKADWAALEPYWADRVIPPSRGWHRDIRPVNFPPRRLAAVAQLLVRSFEAGATPLEEAIDYVREAVRILDTERGTRRSVKAARKLGEYFELEDSGGFWNRHYSFQARRAARPSRLIGESTGRSLAFNAMLPAAALAARMRGDEKLAVDVRRLFEVYPRLPGNHIVNFTRERLFGRAGEPRGLLRTERRQQGLFQIFHSCCNGATHHCDCCHYLEGLKHGWPLARS